jgi:hypothetical protein
MTILCGNIPTTSTTAAAAMLNRDCETRPPPFFHPFPFLSLCFILTDIVHTAHKHSTVHATPRPTMDFNAHPLLQHPTCFDPPPPLFQLAPSICTPPHVCTHHRGLPWFFTCYHLLSTTATTCFQPLLPPAFNHCYFSTTLSHPLQRLPPQLHTMA